MAKVQKSTPVKQLYGDPESMNRMMKKLMLDLDDMLKDLEKIENRQKARKLVN